MHYRAFFSPPPPPVPVPGNIATLAENSYACQSSLCCSIQGVGDFSAGLGTFGWHNAFAVNDLVVPADFVNPDSYVDILLFDGHGLPGLAYLYDVNQNCFATNSNDSWGVGNVAGTFQPYPGAFPITTPPNRLGMPVSGRLKWIIFNSSDTVAGPSVVDNSPNWDADWRPAFGGSLHGIYGFWQAPGFCSVGDPNRVCDIDESEGLAVDDALWSLIYGSTAPLPIHDAFVDAANTAMAGDRWSIWEDANAREDALGGPESNPPYATTLSGTLYFYYAQNVLPTPTSSVPIGSETFTLAPYSLVNEPIGDQALTTKYQSYLSGAAITSTASVYDVRMPNFEVRHYGGLSGAVTYHNRANDDPIAFDQTTAQSFAQSFIQQTLGMPSDAVLRAVLKIWKVSVSSGGAVNVGYEFVYGHEAAIFGSDEIKVIVDDHHTKHTTCSPCAGGCSSWYTDDPNVSYGYRLWRSFGTLEPVNGSYSRVSISAKTAATALPTGSTVIGYTSGWWMPSYSTSSSAGATSAWIFTLSGGARIGIDANSGAVLGATHDE